MDTNKRSNAANSLYWVSFYMLFFGLILMIYPDPLGIFIGIKPPMDFAWRIVGMFIIIVGLIGFQAGRTGQMIPLYMLSVYIRTGVLIILTIMVLLGFVKFTILAFGLVDFSCAMWTLFSVKKDLKAYVAGTLHSCHWCHVLNQCNY